MGDGFTVEEFIELLQNPELGDDGPVVSATAKLVFATSPAQVLNVLSVYASDDGEKVLVDLG